jgi:hypothetical protein
MSRLWAKIKIHYRSGHRTHNSHQTLSGDCRWRWLTPCNRILIGRVRTLLARLNSQHFPGVRHLFGYNAEALLPDVQKNRLNSVRAGCSPSPCPASNKVTHHSGSGGSGRDPPNIVPRSLLSTKSAKIIASNHTSGKISPSEFRRIFDRFGLNGCRAILLHAYQWFEMCARGGNPESCTDGGLTEVCGLDEESEEGERIFDD